MARNTVTKYDVLSAEKLIIDWLGDHPTERDEEIVAKHLYDQRIGNMAECMKMVRDILATQ